MNTINIPVLALRGMTAFPGETVSFDVEREISIFALDNAMEGDRRLFLVTQRKIGVSEPEERDRHGVPCAPDHQDLRDYGTGAGGG